LRRYSDIHEETSATVFSRIETFSKEFVRRERNEKLSVISIQMVMNRGCRDDGTWSRSIKNKQKRTKNKNLGDTIRKLINRKLRISTWTQKDRDVR
jgi:hypothetical protein